MLSRRAVLPLTISAGWISVLPGVLAAWEVEPEPVFTQAGLALTDDYQASSKVLYSSAARLLEAALAATKCEFLGLEIGQKVLPSMLGMPIFLAKTSTTVAQGLACMAQHFSLHDQGGTVTLENRGNMAKLCYRVIEPGAEDTNIIYDLALTIGLNILRTLCGNPDWAPSQVNMTSAVPANPEYYHKVFGAPVQFLAEDNALLFPPAWLETSIPTGDPILHGYLQGKAEAMLHKMGPSLVVELDRVLREHILSSNCSASQVAHLLCMHERTLHRRLQEDGTSFRQELDRVRSNMACSMLKNSALSIEQIAEQLKYRHVTSFSRAFKRLTGSPPAQWRQAKGKSGPDFETRELE